MSYKAQRIPAIFVCFFLLVSFKSNAFITPLDSIGIEKQGNKVFILHKVDPKETLYSLARRYNAKVESIQEENPELKEGLKEGQVLRIPFQPKRSESTTAQKQFDKGAKIHTVSTGQTLYSISRTYNVSVEDIKKWNNLTSNELNLGQEIQVGLPTVKLAQPNVKTQEDKSTKEEVSQVPNFRYDSKGNKIHVTEAGQTLFTISQIYNTPIEDIKEWNRLASNEIVAGQQIIVGRSKSTEVEQKQDSNQAKVANAGVPAVSSNLPHQNEQNKTSENSSQPVKQSTSSSGFNKIIDRGLAEAIEESEDNPKFLALHKTASVGTIIQVKNELNNLYIFARVIGRLPQSSANDKLVIKLSKKAYDKLGAVDKRFPVEVSYVPND